MPPSERQTFWPAETSPGPKTVGRLRHHALGIGGAFW